MSTPRAGVARHVRDGARAEDPDAVELAATEQHLGEPVVIRPVDTSPLPPKARSNGQGRLPRARGASRPAREEVGHVQHSEFLGRLAST